MSLTHVYVIDSPGHILHGEDSAFYADSRELADAKAEAHRRVVGADLLTHVGTRDCGRFVASIPYELLPAWAREWVDEQQARVAKARGRAKHFRGAV